MKALADRYPRLRRLIPFVLVAAVVLIYQWGLAPFLPDDHTVVLRFEPNAAGVRRVDTTWTEVSSAEATAGATYHFAAGQAPPELHTTVRVPGAEYFLDVVIDVNGKTQLVRRRVALNTDFTKVSVPLE